MSSRGDKAYELFTQGYNCSQAVAVTFADKLGLDEETAAKIAGGFGGGMGRMREVCGTFSGIVMVLSMVYGYSDPKEYDGKKELYEKIRNLADKFRADNGSIVCRELLGLDKAESSAAPEKRTDEYYKKRPCPELCRYAADILEQFLEENPPME